METSTAMSIDLHLKNSSTGHRTTAIVCLLVMSLALRPGIVSIGPLLLEIRRDFALTYSEASLMTSIPDLCMGLFVLFVPRISQILGLNRTITASLILLGAAILLRATAHSTQALLIHTTLVGIGIAIAGALIGGWIKGNFPEESSLFMGIYAGGLSVGSTITAVATSHIAEKFGGWRVGSGAWCIVAVAAVASWMYLTRHFEAMAGAGTGTTPKAVVRSTIKLPWFNRRAWLLAIFFGLCQFIAYACIAWTAPWNSEVHASKIPGGEMLSLFMLFLAAGSFAAAVFSGTPDDRRLSLMLSSILSIVGLAGLAFVPTSYPAIFVMMVAFGQGMCFALGMVLPLDNTHSTDEAHAWSMFVLFVGYLVAAAGPLTFGFLRDKTGGFFDSYIMLILVSFAMMATIPFLERHPIPLA
jgi:CP family cyanate transporter-like MFS transporter